MFSTEKIRGPPPCNTVYLICIQECTCLLRNCTSHKHTLFGALHFYHLAVAKYTRELPFSLIFLTYHTTGFHPLLPYLPSKQTHYLPSQAIPHIPIHPFTLSTPPFTRSPHRFTQIIFFSLHSILSLPLTVFFGEGLRGSKRKLYLCRNNSRQASQRCSNRGPFYFYTLWRIKEKSYYTSPTTK